MSQTLLAIDGDSLAHRAYHAMPKSIRGNGRPANALVGFAGFLIRLWDAEQPDSVLVGWDSLETPTYRHDALPAYQSGRVFEDAILEQLNVLPVLTESFGFAVGKAPGYEADDFLAAAAVGWPGPVTVVTSDRDAFQLVSDRVSILQPVKGVSELARIGPDEVRERYGVEPSQVPDFIALRGDPSDKIPGAPGVGPKKAAEVLKQHGSLEQALADGRFSTIADELRLYRRDRDDGRRGAAAPARADPSRLGAGVCDGLGARVERPREAAGRASLGAGDRAHQPPVVREPAPDRTASGVAGSDRRAARALRLRRV